MTDKKWVRMLNGAKLEAMAGKTLTGTFAEKEIARRKMRQVRKSSRLA